MSSDLYDGPSGSDLQPGGSAQPGESAVGGESVAGLAVSNQNEPPLVDLLVGDSATRPAFAADASLHYGEGEDSLDLADILLGEPGSENIDGYLLAINHGSSSTLLVDTEGTGNFTNPDLVLEIGGVDWDSGTAGQMADLVTDSVIVVA